jgi:hypothetical protein
MEMIGNLEEETTTQDSAPTGRAFWDLVARSLKGNLCIEFEDFECPSTALRYQREVLQDFHQSGMKFQLV